MGAWEQVRRAARSPRNGLPAAPGRASLASRQRSRAEALVEAGGVQAGRGWGGGCRQGSRGSGGRKARQGFMSGQCTPAGRPAPSGSFPARPGHCRRGRGRQGRSCRSRLAGLWQQRPTQQHGCVSHQRMRVLGPKSTWEFLPSRCLPKGGSTKATLHPRRRAGRGPCVASCPARPGRRPAR